MIEKYGWLIVVLGSVIVLIKIGRALRGRRAVLRWGAIVLLMVATVQGTIVLGGFISVDVYTYYDYQRSPDLAVMTPQLIALMSLPPFLRPACEGVPHLCYLQAGYEFYTIFLIVGCLIAYFPFAIVWFFSREPRDKPKRTSFSDQPDSTII